MDPREQLRRKIEAEYRQLPRLRLTLPQATLLFGADADTCGSVLQELIAAGVLRRTLTGHYVALATASRQRQATLPPRHLVAVLFTRHDASVRLVRIARSDGTLELAVHGPGPSAISYVLTFTECLQRQSRIEHTLIAEGYHLHKALAERRSGRERRHSGRGPDRRRSA